MHFKLGYHEKIYLELLNPSFPPCVGLIMYPHILRFFEFHLGIIHFFGEFKLTEIKDTLLHQEIILKLHNSYGPTQH